MLFRVSILILGLIQLTLAQSTQSTGAGKTNKADQNRYLRILPLGNMHLPDEKLINGIRELQPPKPGEAPPSTLAPQGEIAQEKPLKITIDSPSRFAAFGPEVKEVKLFDAKEAGQLWFQFPTPALQRSLAVLYRDHQKLDWRHMKSLILKDDALAFPLGAARFVNVSDRSLLLQFTFRKKGKSLTSEKGRLKPGQSYLRRLSAGGEKVKIMIINSGENLLLREEMLKPDQKQRIQYFFYKNSLKKAPKPVRVVTFPEKIPPLPLLNLTARAKKAE